MTQNDISEVSHVTINNAEGAPLCAEGEGADGENAVLTIKGIENSMARRNHTMERRRHPRVSVRLPLEYWETDDARHGGLVENISEMGLLIYSIQDFPVGTHLSVKVFFSRGSEFDGFQVRTRIAWKGQHREPQWKGFLYGLEFTAIFDADRQKLMSFLSSRIPSEGTDAHVQNLL